MTSDSNSKSSLDIKHVLNLQSLQDQKYKYNTESLFNEYNSYFTNSINRELNAYSVAFSLYSVFNILSHVPCFIFSNLSLFVIGMYMVIYNNINEKIGMRMTSFMGTMYLCGVIRQSLWSNPCFWYFNILTIPVSAGLFVICNKRYEEKSYKDLLKMRYELLLIAPLHSYVYLEDKYRLKRCAGKIYEFILNYVKKYSTSDVIRDELKDRGVDDISESENERNTDNDHNVNEDEDEESDTEVTKDTEVSNDTEVSKDTDEDKKKV
jgi:hypothetical protein